MKKIIILITGFFVYASVYANMFVHSPTNDKPPFVFVGGYASKINLTDNGYDILAMIHKTNAIRKQLTTDSLLTIFIPPTKTTTAQVLQYTLQQLQDNVEVTLKAAVPSDPSYQLWSFDGPKVERIDGKVIGGVLYIDGCAESVRIVNGSFNGSFYLPKTQRDIQYIIISPIGDLYVQKISLPNYQPASRHKLGQEVIRIQPPKNKVVSIVFTNLSNPLPDTTDVSVEAVYCKTADGKYGFEVTVKSRDKVLFGSALLSDDIQDEYFIALTPERQLTNYKVVETIPASFIEVDYSLSLSQETTEVSNRSFDNGKTKMDWMLKTFLILLVAVPTLFFLIRWYIRRRKAKKQQANKSETTNN